MTMRLEDALERLRATGHVEAVAAVEDELGFTRKQRDLAQQALAANERRAPAEPREYRESTFRVTDFARNCAVDLGGAGEFRFGLDGQKTAAALRELADAFERGRLIPQEVTASEDAKVDEFTLATVAITVADRNRDAP